VVKSLLEGPRDGDTVEELYERLRALPSVSEELFRKILHRLNPFNFRQSCEVFLLHKAAGLPITLPDLALARERYDKAFLASLCPFTESELEYHSLNSRCKGPLKVSDVATKKREAKVQYPHRTVQYFSQQTTVMDTFDPVLQLSAAYLARIKSIKPRARLVMVNEFWCAFLKGIHNAKQIKSDKTCQMFLDHLDETSTRLWKQGVHVGNSHMACM
jgi:hypothetical protein